MAQPVAGPAAAAAAEGYPITKREQISCFYFY
jgi:hypothetical protein